MEFYKGVILTPYVGNNGIDRSSRRAGQGWVNVAAASPSIWQVSEFGASFRRFPCFEMEVSKNERSPLYTPNTTWEFPKIRGPNTIPK